MSAIQVHKLPPKGFAANCYLVTLDGENAIAIDPARSDVFDRAQEMGLKIGCALLTHGHFDHVGGAAALQSVGVEIGCLQSERSLAMHHNLGERFSCPVPPFSVDFTFEDGDKLELFGMSVSVMGTPGHTAGSCCYLISPSPSLPGCALFSGDTLFVGDVGRTDLPTGDRAQLRESLRKLCSLEGDLPVYPGHGENTTLAAERRWLVRFLR